MIHIPSIPSFPRSLHLAQFQLSEKAIILREGDDVAVLTQPLQEGTELVTSGLDVRLAANVPAGHKVALTSIKEGHPVHKYGQIIGYATADIAPGDWIHSHNLHNGRLGLSYEFGTDIRASKPLEPAEERTFMGY